MLSSGPTGRSRRAASVVPALLLMLTLAPVAAAHDHAAGGEHEELDPARNVPIPCEVLAPTLGLPARSARNIEHVANRCGFVGTDVEFQSRTDSVGKVHDYAFVGTMGAGFRIFDITNPANPTFAGGYVDSGWQNDIQVRGDIAVSTFDGVAGEPSTASTCLQAKVGSNGQGVDIFRLAFDPGTATFNVQLLGCVANPPGGAHNATIHPSGQWLAIANSSSDWAVDVVDLRDPANFVHRYRLIDQSRRGDVSKCPASGATFTCLTVTKRDWSSAAGLWRPHDVSFSRNGHRMYVAGLNATFIVNVRHLMTKAYFRTMSIIPNISEPPEPGSTDPLSNPRNIELSHQADPASDEKILVISDEKGGGLSNTSCNTNPRGGTIGGLHFWAIGRINRYPQTYNATFYNPVKLGSYFNPNPTLIPDPLQLHLDNLRIERACTSHVFRLGGNGTTGVGPDPAYDGISRLPKRRLVMGWYGAGVWFVHFGIPTTRPTGYHGVQEEPRSNWGNTIGWNVQVGSEVWSAKEYKGYIYAGDMLRGFDVYRFTTNPYDPAVTLTKSGPTSAAPGQQVSFRIEYGNAVPNASHNARITDRLPEGLEFVSANGPASYDPLSRTVTWSLGNVAPGGRGAFTLTALVAPSARRGSFLVNRADFRGDLTVSAPAYSITRVE